MAEYIKREDVLRHKRKMNGADFSGEFWDEAVLCEDICKIPTADVVEVVRCKDCKHATFYACKNDACYRGIICEYQIGTDDENFFCSYGERRTYDGNL